MQPSQSSLTVLCGVQIPPTRILTPGAGQVTAHLLSVLFEESELEALVQLQLPDVPHLMEVLPGGVQLVQQTGHLAGSKTREVSLLMSHQHGAVFYQLDCFLYQ